MFLLNLGGRGWNLAEEIDELRGAVLLSSANADVRFTRKAGPQLGRLLIDPQIYLAGLDKTSCSKVCGRLATHPWFLVPDVPAFDSGVHKQREWQKEIEGIAADHWPGVAPEGDGIEDSCRAAIECQVQFGCSHVIIPSPLLTEREDEGATLAAWLDAGLGVAGEMEVGQPLLATIAVHESTLNDPAFNPAGFLDALVDHVTAREGLGGAYVVVALAGAPAHPFQTNLKALRAYLHLSRALKEGGVDVVLLNFADVFGFVCTAVGATDVATGASQNGRRLSLTAFRDEGGGLALPHYYSHKVVGEFTPQTEMDKIVAAKMLRRVADPTTHSEDLLDALRAGRSAGTLAAWVESQNNLTAAQRHFVCRLALEGDRIRKLSPAKRDGAVRDWLEEAHSAVLFIKDRMNTPVIGRVAPTGAWLDLLE
jgi:hypothetical protein